MQKEKKYTQPNITVFLRKFFLVAQNPCLPLCSTPTSKGGVDFQATFSAHLPIGQATQEIDNIIEQRIATRFTKMKSGLWKILSHLLTNFSHNLCGFEYGKSKQSNH